MKTYGCNNGLISNNLLWLNSETQMTVKCFQNHSFVADKRLDYVNWLTVQMGLLRLVLVQAILDLSDIFLLQRKLAFRLEFSIFFCISTIWKYWKQKG